MIFKLHSRRVDSLSVKKLLHGTTHLVIIIVIIIIVVINMITIVITVIAMAPANECQGSLPSVVQPTPHGGKPRSS